MRFIWVAGTRAGAREGRKILLGDRICRAPRRAARRSRGGAPAGARRREAPVPCGADGRGCRGFASSPARLQERGDAADEGILGEDQALGDIAGEGLGIGIPVEGAAERLDPHIAAVGH